MRRSDSLTGRLCSAGSMEQTRAMKVYGTRLSGNCYKVRLLLELLGKPYSWHAVDILAGDTQTPEFAQLNPNRKVPVVEVAPGVHLTESNAILNYLAEGTPFLPAGGLDRARVLEWQFFEQYSHEPNIAVARFIKLFQGLPPERLEEFEAKQVGGHKALAVMEQHLAREPYLAAGIPTIADLSLFAYTHVADQGGFDLAGYPAIGRWLERVRALPGFVAM